MCWGLQDTTRLAVTLSLMCQDTNWLAAMQRLDQAGARDGGVSRRCNEEGETAQVQHIVCGQRGTQSMGCADWLQAEGCPPPAAAPAADICEVKIAVKLAAGCWLFAADADACCIVCLQLTDEGGICIG